MLTDEEAILRHDLEGPGIARVIGNESLPGSWRAVQSLVAEQVSHLEEFPAYVEVPCGKGSLFLLLREERRRGDEGGNVAQLLGGIQLVVEAVDSSEPGISISVPRTLFSAWETVCSRFYTIALPEREDPCKKQGGDASVRHEHRRAGGRYQRLRSAILYIADETATFAREDTVSFREIMMSLVCYYY